MTKRIMITGANGMLGSSLCMELRGKIPLIACHRDERCLVSGIEEVTADITSLDMVKGAVAKAHPDIIIHCAGLINIDQCETEPSLAYQVNVEGTKNLAMAAGDNSLFIYISTDQVYGTSTDRTEQQHQLDPVNSYGKTKYLGEQAVKALCPNHIIIRTNMFGWNVKPGRISSAEWIYSSLSSGRTITLFRDYIFSPIYSRCLGTAIMGLMECKACGVFNIGSHECCSKYEFGLALAEAFGFDPSPIRAGSISDITSPAQRPSNLRLDTGKYEALTNQIFHYHDSLSLFAADVKK